MNSHRSLSPPDRFFLFHFGDGLTLLVVLFISLLSLAPYDFLAPAASSRPWLFVTTTASNVTATDAMGNIALYVPLGFLLPIVLRRCISRGLFRAAATLILAGALSASMEWIQAFSPARVSSLIDVAANLIGAGIGLMIAVAFESILPDLLGALLYDLRCRPAVAGIRVYCGLLILFAMTPFTFTFDVQRLATAYKESSFIPFATPPAELNIAEEAKRDLALNRDPGSHVDLLRWMVMRRWMRWAAEAASFAVLAMLLRMLFQREYAFSRRGATGLTWWLGGLFTVILSVVQLPVATRAVDATDVVFRLFGVACGLAVASSKYRRWACEDSGEGWDFMPGLIRMGSAFAAIYVFYTGVIPLSFDIENSTIGSAISSRGFLPFTAYSTARHDAVFSDLTEKIAAYAVLGGLLAAGSGRGGGHRASVARVLLRCVGLSSVVELVQVYVPLRVPSLTDPMLAGFGGLLGVGMHRMAASLIAFASENPMVGPDDSAATAVAPAMDLTDQLISTLTDPDPQAPVELPSGDALQAPARTKPPA